MDTPVRRLIKPTTPRTVHLLNLKGVLPAPVQAEATTESDFIQLAALCPATRNLISQPETLQLAGRTYTPDFRVETLDGRKSFWEVKLEANIPKYRPLFDLAAKHLADRGEPFFVVSEQALRRRRQDKTVRLMLRYAKGAFDGADVEKVKQHLKTRPKGASLESLTTYLGVTRELIFHLVATRVLALSRSATAVPSSHLIHSDYLEAKDVVYLARWFGVSPWRTNA